jgi:hypothetical protein
MKLGYGQWELSRFLPVIKKLFYVSLKGVNLMTTKENRQKFEELTRDVDWQLDSLLAYIKKGFRVSPRARDKMDPSDLVVQNVLDAYLLLAKRFYEQFTKQLRIAYNRKADKGVAKDSISETEVAILMQRALDKLTAEWERVYGFIASTAAKKTSETREIKNQLAPLIKAAVRDVGFSSDSFPMIPQFGTAYSLGFFNYTDDFMALNLPITALQSPWEWTVFWHEIAGQKVRLLKKTQVEFLNVVRELFIEIRRQGELESQAYPSPIQQMETPHRDVKDQMREYLSLVLSLIVPFPQMNALTEKQTSDLIQALTDCVYDDYLDSQNLSNVSLTRTRKFIQDLSPSRRNLPLLMFSFDDLLSEIMEELRLQQKKRVTETLRKAHTEALTIEQISKDPKKDLLMEKLLAAWDAALSLEETLAAQKKSLDEEGWSADWLEELFEDSFSVLNFDVKFLSVLNRLLHRHTDGGKDLRHPPHHVRLVLAAALKLIECDEALLNRDLPLQVEEFPTGLSSDESNTLNQFYPGTLSVDALAVVWLAAKKFYEMHKRIKGSSEEPDEIIRDAKKVIATAMMKHIDRLDKVENIAKVADEVLTSLAKAVSPLEKTSQGVVSPFGDSTNPHYVDKIETMLRSRNIIPPYEPLGYRELLDLSFYDVDFLKTTITDVQFNGQLRIGRIERMGVLTPEVKNGIVGPITYKVDGNPRATTVANWNQEFENTEYRL